MNAESQETIVCVECGALLPPTAEKCAVCGKDLQPRRGPTVAESEPAELAYHKEREVTQPEPDELPPDLRKMEIALALVVLLFGVILNFGVIGRHFMPDTESLSVTWMDEGLQELVAGQGSHWIRPTQWPPEYPLTVIFGAEPVDELSRHKDRLLDQAGLAVAGDPLVFGFLEVPEIDDLRRQDPDGAWLIVRGINQPPVLLLLDISYWSPEWRLQPLFHYKQRIVPIASYWPLLVTFSGILALALLTRSVLVQRYRRRRRQAYEEFQEQRTAKIFEAKGQLDKARDLAEAGDVAKALVIVNDIMKTMPRFQEARELKKLLLLKSEAGTGALSISPEAISKTAGSASKPTLLYLRVVGTPYAYRAPSGAEAISIGRQRRKPGGGQDVGNDVVVRIPGSDEKSLRISRRHVEIRRIDTDYFAIDMSRGSTRHNGKKLDPGKPVRLRSGDRLQIGGVITLEVLIRFQMFGQRANNILQVDPLEDHQNGLFIEATIGDMLTEIADD